MFDFNQARALLREFKGDTYLYGIDVLPQVGPVVAACGKRAALVRGTFPDSNAHVATLRENLAAAGVTVVGEIKGSAPNSPREDLFRIANRLTELNPDVIVGFGGGSTLDTLKAAEVLRTLGGAIDDYFGVGLVTKVIQETGKTLTPQVSIQTLSGSSAHLTKYSNITDMTTGQKKLIVDDAITPERPVFDYALTYSAPPHITADGALDGVSHCLEVLYGAVNKPNYEAIAAVAAGGIDLIVNYLPRALKNPTDPVAREALGLGTDLGGYAIMLGSTNGGHLTSFSLVDVLAHGRACALMNPYYTVFFAPAIEAPLRRIGAIYRDAGFTQADLAALHGRALGVAVAEAMLAFSRSIGFPTRLSEVDGFTPAHIERALAAAKNPQLKMKLQAMPIPLTPDQIDAYMGPVLAAASDGDVTRIQNIL